MTQKQEAIQIKTPFAIRFFLWMAIWAHVLVGLFTLFAIFPWASRKTKKLHIQKWSKRLLNIFGIELLAKILKSCQVALFCFVQIIFLGWIFMQLMRYFQFALLLSRR